jgi:acyl carrier protein
MALFDEIRELLVTQLAVKPEMVKPESNVTDDLGADSLDAIELVSALEEKFGVEIADEEAKQITTVGAIVNLVEQKLQTKSSPQP